MGCFNERHADEHTNLLISAAALAGDGFHFLLRPRCCPVPTEAIEDGHNRRADNIAVHSHAEYRRAVVDLHFDIAHGLHF